MKKPEYQVYIRNDWPLPFVEPWAFGPTNLAKPPFKWRMILVANLGDKYAWCYYADDVIKIGHEVDNHLTKSENLREFQSQARKAELENRKFAAKISRMDLAKLTLEKLSDLLWQWYATHNRFTARFMPIDATDETLETDIRLAIQKAGVELSLGEIAALLTPDSPTYVQREHKDFCLLAEQFYHNYDPSAAKKAIVKHADKWWWTIMGWGQHLPLDLKIIRRNLANIKNFPELINQQKSDEQAYRSSLRLKKKLVKKLPKNVRFLLDAFEVLAEMHDTRKEIQMRMMTAGFAITKQLLLKSNIPLAYRRYILVEEYINLAKGLKPSMHELRDRTKAYWCQFTSDGKINMLSGEKAVKRIGRSGINKAGGDQGNTIIKGTPASPGLASGRARVGLNASILNHTIKYGEILVTSQTTPEFAPAMKKAAAIITDEGGITSHAAIVSRELKKPCIIGTKTATRILKSGDLVEVNADQGFIRRLK